jgi:hypothetical protein
MALDFLSPLHKASRQISVYLEAHTRELGVSPAEGHLLTYLGSYTPAPIGELVRVFGLKQSTFLIHISDAGQELAERLNKCLETLEDEIRKRVSPRDLKGFQAVMSAVEEVTRVRLRER